MNKKNTIKKRISKKQKEFLEVYKQKACNVSLTCEAVKIGRTTYYKWRKENKEFDKLCEEVELSLIDLAETQLLKNIREGKETSLIFFLVNRAPDRWKSVNKLEFTPTAETTKKIDIILDSLGKMLKGNEKEEKSDKE